MKQELLNKRTQKILEYVMEYRLHQFESGHDYEKDDHFTSSELRDLAIYFLQPGFRDWYPIRMNTRYQDRPHDMSYVERIYAAIALLLAEIDRVDRLNNPFDYAQEERLEAAPVIDIQKWNNEHPTILPKEEFGLFAHVKDEVTGEHYIAGTFSWVKANPTPLPSHPGQGLSFKAAYPPLPIEDLQDEAGKIKAPKSTVKGIWEQSVQKTARTYNVVVDKRDIEWDELSEEGFELDSPYEPEVQIELAPVPKTRNVTPFGDGSQKAIYERLEQLKMSEEAIRAADEELTKLAKDFYYGKPEKNTEKPFSE